MLILWGDENDSSVMFSQVHKPHVIIRKSIKWISIEGHSTIRVHYSLKLSRTQKESLGNCHSQDSLRRHDISTYFCLSMLSVTFKRHNWDKCTWSGEISLEMILKKRIPGKINRKIQNCKIGATLASSRSKTDASKSLRIAYLSFINDNL